MGSAPVEVLRRQYSRLKRAVLSARDRLFGERLKFQRYYATEQWYGGVGLVEWLNVRFQYAIDAVLGRVPAKTGDSYLTHIPVLLAISRSVKVRRVLELGCGRYSTLTFLDRDCFPDLERLDSIENDREWAENLVELSGADGRLQMRVIGGPVADVLGQFDLDSYDLVFVDDALTREERSRTIGAIGAARPRHPVVVIHDYDMLAYRRAARCFKARFRFTALYPNTGVVWNGRGFHAATLAAMNRLIGGLRAQGRIPADADAAAELFKTQAANMGPA